MRNSLPQFLNISFCPILACMKGVAICSTRQFFTKLEEDKDDDDFGEDGDAL